MRMVEEITRNNLKKNLKIAIIGGNDIGKSLSTSLVSLGYNVELVCRNNHRHIKIDNSYAFEIDGDFGHKSYLVPFVSSIEELSNKDIIICTTKSTDMLERIQKATNKLTPNGMIVTIQNTFSIDKLFKLIPDELSVCMVCDFATLSINKVTHIKNTNGITLGVYNRKCINKMKTLYIVLSEITEVKFTKDIVGFTIGRNIINSAISILGGISGLRLKDILNDRNGRYLFCKIIEESVRLCNRYRVKIIPYNFQLDYYKFVEKSIKGRLYRHKIIRRLIKQNGKIKSSALKCLENNEKTEITYLIDRFMHLARKGRVTVECIPTLNKILKDIESGKRNIDKNIFHDKEVIKLIIKK